MNLQELLKFLNSKNVEISKITVLGGIASYVSLRKAQKGELTEEERKECIKRLQQVKSSFNEFLGRHASKLVIATPRKYKPEPKGD